MGVRCMIQDLIDSVREELDELIKRDASFQEVYNMSIQLDKLIVNFYTEAFMQKYG